MIPLTLIHLMLWFAGTDSDNLVHITLGAPALLLIADRVWERFQARKSAKNGDGDTGSTPKAYWDDRLDRIEDITKKQTDIVEAQNGILTRLVVIAESQERRQMTEDAIRKVDSAKGASA